MSELMYVDNYNDVDAETHLANLSVFRKYSVGDKVMIDSKRGIEFGIVTGFKFSYGTPKMLLMVLLVHVGVEPFIDMYDPLDQSFDIIKL